MGGDFGSGFAQTALPQMGSAVGNALLQNALNKQQSISNLSNALLEKNLTSGDISGANPALSSYLGLKNTPTINQPSTLNIPTSLLGGGIAAPMMMASGAPISQNNVNSAMSLAQASIQAAKAGQPNLAMSYWEAAKSNVGLGGVPMSKLSEYTQINQGGQKANYTPAEKAAWMAQNYPKQYQTLATNYFKQVMLNEPMSLDAGIQSAKDLTMKFRSAGLPLTVVPGVKIMNGKQYADSFKVISMKDSASTYTEDQKAMLAKQMGLEPSGIGKSGIYYSRPTQTSQVIEKLPLAKKEFLKSLIKQETEMATDSGDFSKVIPNLQKQLTQAGFTPSEIKSVMGEVVVTAPTTMPEQVVINSTQESKTGKTIKDGFKSLMSGLSNFNSADHAKISLDKKNGSGLNEAVVNRWESNGINIKNIADASNDPKEVRQIKTHLRKNISKLLSNNASLRDVMAYIQNISQQNREIATLKLYKKRSNG